MENLTTSELFATYEIALSRINIHKEKTRDFETFLLARCELEERGYF